jgi:hypothetical protein
LEKIRKIVSGLQLEILRVGTLQSFENVNGDVESIDSMSVRFGSGKMDTVLVSYERE